VKKLKKIIMTLKVNCPIKVISKLIMNIKIFRMTKQINKMIDKVAIVKKLKLKLSKKSINLSKLMTNIMKHRKKTNKIKLMQLIWQIIN
jgi:hypothetical protein